MDVADVFRQGLGSVLPRPPQYALPRKAPPAAVFPPQPQPLPHPHAAQFFRDDAVADDNASPNRIAHTLTACCRCRQRKTRCDPNLPRCLPCERSGSVCEYFDTTKNKKISRNYVVKLQDRVRKLEAELAQYTDEDNEYPRSPEEIMRPGGMVLLNETDETPRYLGPSSGIAMTRLLMEEAKRYTESKRIADLIPEVRTRRMQRLDRMQSIVSTSGSISAPGGRKKSYPMISAVAAQNLPTRPIADKLVDVFNQRAQVFMPTLHEGVFADDLNAVFDGDQDPYRNFVVRMVIAISLQKLDTQYAGLADSYYLAAMQHFEDVVRPKDLKTLQCLALIAQYSMLTPTRTAAYYIVGLATRICQQLGLGEEKTIALGITDAQTLDMRRRLCWIITSIEFGLASGMGRPNGFAKGNDFINVGFFSSAADECITEQGIEDGAPSEKKLVAIHFAKLMLCQAEIRRVLYEKKRPEPNDESHPWFAQMQQKLEEWRDLSPENPEWCKPWFTGHYHCMVVSLYRPSPQIPKPSSRAAMTCYESSAFIINLSSQQVKKSAVDITWVFLMSLSTALNTLLWSLSYPDVRAVHQRDELEELVKTALEILEQCSERWPGSASTAQLYLVLAKACMQSYDMKEEPQSSLNTPSSMADPNSPPMSEMSMPTTISSASSRQQHAGYSPVQFGYVFDSPPERMTTTGFGYEPDGQHSSNIHPTFRSNSIFFNPSTDSTGRRGSVFAPDFTQDKEEPWPEPVEEPTPPATTTPRNLASPPAETPFPNRVSPPMSTSATSSLPTPPESLAALPSTNASGIKLSPSLTAMGVVTTSAAASPAMTAGRISPIPMTMQATQAPMTSSIKYEVGPLNMKYEPEYLPQVTKAGATSMAPPRTTPAFTIPPPASAHVAAQQRPLPTTTVTDWFSPPPPLISPYMAFPGNMANAGGQYWTDGAIAPTSNGVTAPHAPQYVGAGLGLANNGMYTFGGRAPHDLGPAPHPSHHAQANLSNGGMADGLFRSEAMFGEFPMAGHAAAAAAYSFGGVPSLLPGRHGSLSHEQQRELMDVLETEGASDIDHFLNMSIGFNGGPGGAVRWG